MDDQILLQLASSAITQRMQDAEKVFDALGIDGVAVMSRSQALTALQRRQLRRLFTDYEWMLAQKVIDPESAIPVWNQFQEAKLVVARQWLALSNTTTKFLDDAGKTPVMHLQLRLTYAPNLADVLDFVLPQQVVQRLESKPLALLTWSKEQLE
ncbi:hypothetical protein [Lacticaseibacillus saniviri]|nr:hypothetical protein [Lacticaseibacillus saniviri]MCG4281508.1 hypothetical protein [Lacticaseibacillus saniviri]